MATGLTTGPFFLQNGQLLTINDPYKYSQPAAKIQIQNATGFNCFVQSQGAGYNIQPFQAATIPSNYGHTITIVPTYTGNVTSGGLIAVWLLEGQDPPIQDGPLNFAATSSHTVTVTYPNVNWPSIGGAGQYFLTDVSLTVQGQLINNINPGTGLAWSYVWLCADTGAGTFGTTYGGPFLATLGQFQWTTSFTSGIPQIAFTLVFGNSTPVYELQGYQVNNLSAYASN